MRDYCTFYFYLHLVQHILKVPLRYSLWHISCPAQQRILVIWIERLAFFLSSFFWSVSPDVSSHWLLYLQAGIYETKRKPWLSPLFYLFFRSQVPYPVFFLLFTFQNLLFVAHVIKNFSVILLHLPERMTAAMKLKRRLLLGRKVMTNLDSILKSRDITLPPKVHLVKVFLTLAT